MITLRLTKAEARELLGAAGNGYGDGDFYGLNNVGYPPDTEQKRGNRAYLRAENKLRLALNGAK